MTEIGPTGAGPISAFGAASGRHRVVGLDPHVTRLVHRVDANRQILDVAMSAAVCASDLTFGLEHDGRVTSFLL